MAAKESDRPLSKLMDATAVRDELGVKRATAERVMRLCPRKVVLGRRIYVYRADVSEVLKAHEIRDAA
jgi:hypothetical protein